MTRLGKSPSMGGDGDFKSPCGDLEGDFILSVCKAYHFSYIDSDRHHVTDNTTFRHRFRGNTVMISTLRHCSNPSTPRRNGSCELERLNHLLWVVKVIQITLFRVVI